MTDIHQALDLASWWQHTLDDLEPDTTTFTLIMSRVMAERTHVAARAHADFLDGFPSDEDVEIAKSEFGSEFIKQLGWGESKPFAALEVYAIAREAARAALLAVADARRTEEK